jgi:hypothetical protein
VLKPSQGTVSSQKHELLFSRFGVTYAHIDERFRKGSVLVRQQASTSRHLTFTLSPDADVVGCSCPLSQLRTSPHRAILPLMPTVLRPMPTPLLLRQISRASEPKARSV